MRNVCKIVVLFVVISISQEIEITTSEPTNSNVEVTTPTQQEEVLTNQTKASPSVQPKPGGATQSGSPLPESLNSTTSSSETLVTTTEYVKPQTVLEYKPLKPFHQPLPINHLLPPAKPLLESAEGHETVKPTKSPVQTFPPDLVDRFPELTTLNKRTTPVKVVNNNRQPATSTEDNIVKPVTVLGYQPITSFYHPQHVTLAQIIPPGNPLPASAEGYETTNGFSETTLRPEFVTSKRTTPKTPPSKKTKLPWLISRKTTQTTSQPVTMKTSTEENLEPITVLEYQPTTTFYHPNPVTPAQLIPPGKPWPASPEEHPTTVGSSPTTSSPALTTEYVEALTVLEYKPSTSFYHPHPVTIPQLVPSGKPWPASAEGHQTTIGSSSTATSSPALDERFPESITKLTSKFPDKVTTEYVEAQTVLEYKPSTSFHHNPATIAPLVPPGKPWPASANETLIEPASALTPNLTERFPELVGVKTTTPKTTDKKTTKKPEPKPTVSSAVTPSSTRIILTYKPQRPWYHPRPGNTVGQIIPPGKPWPSSPSGYPSFTVTTFPPWLKDSIDKDAEKNEISAPYYKAEELQSLKEDPSLEPNALQYYGPSITAKPTYNIPPTPFTSGTQKTTISDIVDILREVHNITLVSGNSPPNPSDLLPFDVNKGSEVGSPVMRRPPPPRKQQQQYPPPVQVYDGAVGFDGQRNRDRIFTNPKFVTAQ